MVRSQTKQTPEDKKEGKKKSSAGPSSSTKKKPDTGSWPCKMDGCTKVFAREADLKRHQRTTKTHSIPGFQCPQCDATFTRTDALRRHQKSRHNGVIIEPEQDKDKDTVDGASSGSRSPSPSGTASRSQGDGSMNGSPPAGSSGSPERPPGSYYRIHTIQDGYYAGYPPPPRPPPGMILDAHYPPPPMSLPTSATRGSWPSASASAPHPQWGTGPDGHPMVPPPGMYMPSYYPAGYYRPPGMPGPPHMSQINPELLAQSNGHASSSSNGVGVGPPESALRNTSAAVPKRDLDPSADRDAQMGESSSVSSSASQSQPGSIRGDRQPPDAAPSNVAHSTSLSGEPPSASAADQPQQHEAGADASTLMAAAALQAVLAYQEEQQMRELEVASRASTHSVAPPQVGTHLLAPVHAIANGSVSLAGGPQQTPAGAQRVSVEQPPDAGPSVVPVHGVVDVDADADGVEDLEEDNPDLDAIGEPDPELLEELARAAASAQAEPSSSHIPPHPDEETPMLNPG
ncbi:hypothetical protein C8Q80DRAFT_1277318 [Daedaleopsis nitida]|nr:hypothetical protein C8Q80DRAFT_1277318 [Daedaleopsis nitida]